MTVKVQKKSKQSPKSSQPYKRRSESEMFDIIKEIHEQGLPKKAACVKYGLNRNTLKRFNSFAKVNFCTDNKISLFL